MSVEKVEELLQRATTEPGFAALIGADPERLAKFELEPEEAAALLAQDADKLREMGVDAELAEGARLIGRLTG